MIDRVGDQVVHIVHNQPLLFQPCVKGKENPKKIKCYVTYFESIIMIISTIQVYINIIYALRMTLRVNLC
jgi:hypothetical protein